MTQTPHSDQRPATAVLAGCGDLGTRVGRRLHAVGYDVLGLRRNIDAVPTPIRGQSADLTQRRPQLPSETAVVVIALTADSRTSQGYQDTFRTGLHHVLDALDRDVTGTPRIVLVSSTAVYGINDGRWVDERSPTTPTSATAVVLREAEALLHSRVPTACALRLGGLYGGGRSTLLDSVRRGASTLPPHPVYTNRIHRDDAAAAITHLVTRDAEPDGVYLGVDDDPAERGEVLRFLADRLHVPHPSPSAQPSDRGAGKRCRNHRLRSTGFRFTYPTYREGYDAIITSGTPPTSA